MPTKKKRVGFIPREDVMKIIEKLSLEKNLSNSKIISILVEEALSIRGVFNEKTGKAIETLQEKYYSSIDLFEYYSDCKDDVKFINNTKLNNYKNSKNANLLKQKNQISFDLETYKKFLLFLKFQEMMDKYNN